MGFMTCTECGSEVPGGATSCRGCGNPIASSPSVNPGGAVAAAPARRSRLIIPAAIALTLLAFWYWFGLYSLQPIGALPEGRTAIVRRVGDEPFFNSPDGTCLRRTGSVSLMCRAMAMGVGPLDRIVLRLPYMRWAYLASTGGNDFDR